MNMAEEIYDPGGDDEEEMSAGEGEDQILGKDE